MSALIFVGGLGAVAPETAAFFDTEVQIMRYMQNLQQPYFLGLYGKLLIPRLGT